MYFDVEDELFLINGSAQFDAVGNLHGRDLICCQVQERADEALKYPVIALKQCAEKVIVGHPDGH